MEIGGGNYTLHYKWHRRLHYRVHYRLLHVYLANTVVVEIGRGNYTLHHKWHRKLHYQVHYGLLHVYLALYVAEANDDMHIAREFFGEPAHRCSGVGGRDRVEGVEENVHRF